MSRLTLHIKKNHLSIHPCQPLNAVDMSEAEGAACGDGSESGPQKNANFSK